jgi:putative FmdB family regulatory protein
MPIYEYYCAVCDCKFDKMRPMSRADDAASCPRCERPAGRCASTFAARGSDGKAVAGSNGGCAGCASHSCASCGGH